MRSYSPEPITSWSVAAAALHLACCICALPSNAVAAPQVARPTSAPLYDCGSAARASVASCSIRAHTSAGLAVAGRSVGVGGVVVSGTLPYSVTRLKYMSAHELRLAHDP